MQIFALPSAPAIIVFPQSLNPKHRSARSCATSISNRSSCSNDPFAKKNHMFTFGMGFVGRYVGQKLLKECGWEVSGTCTTPIKKKVLEEMGFDATVFDANEDSLESLRSLQYATHLIASVPPHLEMGDPLLSSNENLQNALRNGNLKWLCYLSTTSVYGDCSGALINEDYPARPLTKSGKARLLAERQWLDLGKYLGVSTYILRLGGIYGPGRSAVDTLLKGTSPSNSQRTRATKGFIARMHVADIYEATKASFDLPTSGRIYNLVDDNPAPRAEVFAYAQDLINEKLPGKMQTLVQYQKMKNEMIGEKRVSNARLKEELGVKLIYPDYKSGLDSIVRLHAEK